MSSLMLLYTKQQLITTTIISVAKRSAEIQFDTLGISIKVVIKRPTHLAAANNVKNALWDMEYAAISIATTNNFAFMGWMFWVSLGGSCWLEKVE
jgi:hypothetical protein